jgi:pimeloyl-ACP methyl ester carboxylesterase
MKNVSIIATLILGLFLHCVASAQPMSTAFKGACKSTGCAVFDISREVVHGDIVHYSATLKVGPGERDVVGIHRVVREISAWRPRSTPRNIFLVHGDTLNFNAAYFVGPDGGSAASSFSVYLASRNIDVWGIDLRWAKIPEDTASFEFMADWNLETDVRDARIAMLVARAVRAVTGSGFGKLTYLGWSRGGQIGYVLTQQESQIPSVLRSVSALVPVDTLLKTNNEALRQQACSIGAQIANDIASGIYQDAGGALIRTAGNLALIDPDGASPIIPGLTNYQVVLLFGGATFQFNPYIPTYHLVAASFDATGQVPTGLLYTDEQAFIATTTQVSPYESKGTMYQGDAVVCGDTSLDDHLADVTVPVLYIGAQGGFGDLGIYTTTLLGGEVEILNVQLRPDAERLFDFGHDDVIRSPLAKELVWNPLLEWMSSH